MTAPTPRQVLAAASARKVLAPASPSPLAALPEPISVGVVSACDRAAGLDPQGCLLPAQALAAEPAVVGLDA